MIQMGDSIAVERCLQNLNNVTIGTDGRLQLGFSKQAFLSDVTNPYILPDKTASFKDFTGSKNNRYSPNNNRVATLEFANFSNAFPSFVRFASNSDSHWTDVFAETVPCPSIRPRVHRDSNSRLYR